MIEKFNIPEIFVLIFVVSLLGGCASVTGYPQRSEDTSITLAALQSRYFLPEKNVIEEYDNKSNGQPKVNYRNEVVTAHMRAIDINFSEFQKQMYKEAKITSLSFGFLGIFFGAAGTAVNSENASRTLSALSTVVAAERTDIDKTLYLEETLPAIIATMEANRARVRAEIFKGLTLDESDYTLSQALSDLERYYHSGTIPGALVSITSTAGELKQEADTEIKVIRDRNFVNQEAQNRVSSAVEMVKKLSNAAALEIVTYPPSQLDEYTLDAVKNRLGGNALVSDKGKDIMKNDPNAKKILKMILVIINDRSEENLVKWSAAIKAQL